MKVICAVVVMIVSAVCGICFQDQPYRLNVVVQPTDQLALDHRDSPYSSITWVASQEEDFLQLRFFDRVEGGVCLHPSWQELIDQSAQQPTLAHLVPKPSEIPNLPGGPMWHQTWVPNPGALSNSAYIRLFPISVLMNHQLMDAAGGDFHATRPRILVVGLGSGIGIATLAYHFPLAEITVVDIDQVVVDMVNDHYPMLHWLALQRLSNGAPRLRFQVRDARQFIRYDAARETAAGHPYDVIILDAYTSGSTIPPHLMTREFYHQCFDVLSVHGMLMANVIGSYQKKEDSNSTKYKVLGGAIRTMRAAGYDHIPLHVWNFPVMTNEDPAHFDMTVQRNNILLASRDVLDPKGNSAGWQRLHDFVPYPELKAGVYMSTTYVFVAGDVTDKHWLTAAIPGALIDRVDPGIAARLTPVNQNRDGTRFPLTTQSMDREVVEACARCVKDAVAKHLLGKEVKGVSELDTATEVRRMETDWTLAAQETFKVTIETARDASMHSDEALVGLLPEGPERDAAVKNWIMVDAPLFTDQRPNADIFNN